MLKRMIHNHGHYKIAVYLSSLSFVFGILREFIIIGILGFSASNDKLQLYLSIFYTVGLNIDAMRLSCLNLYSSLNLSKQILCASIIVLPFTVMLSVLMSLSTDGLDIFLLSITIVGSYLNLIAALLITYKQRSNAFLPAQIINVLPNIILIPGILLWYFFANSNIVYAIVILTSIIPAVQCLLLLFVNHNKENININHSISVLSAIIVFIRHFASLIGEQFFQIILRGAMYNTGVGYLSVFSFIVRVYSAARFILIDTFISSKFTTWENEAISSHFISKTSNYIYVAISMLALLIILNIIPTEDLIYLSIEIIMIMTLGFYFSSLVRIIYFKMNHEKSSPTLIMRYTLFEITCAIIALLISMQLDDSILTLLWLGYIAKPFSQLWLLKTKYNELMLEYGKNP